MLKTVVDANILLLIAICLVLRNYGIHCAAVEPGDDRTYVQCVRGEDIDVFDVEVYDWILVLSFLVSIGGAFCWSIAEKRKIMR